MDDIFRVQKTKDPDTIKYTYYTLFGSHSNLDDEKNPLCDNQKDAMAYTKQINNDNQHYLKVGLYGKLFNPIGLYSEGKQNKFLSKVGKQEYSFTRVNSKVFGMYLNFLRTKNLAWLNNAEREMS